MSFASTPLRHPVPTHPSYLPEAPPTPGTPNYPTDGYQPTSGPASPQGYQRFTSSPGPPQQHLQPPQQQYQQPQQHHQQPPAAITNPFQHSQQQPQQHTGHQYGGQQQQSPGVDFGAWGVNDATAQIGMQLGHSAVAAGQDYVQKTFGLGGGPSMYLKHHFDVSNSYVSKKLRLVLFPWRHKPWTRRVRPAQGEAMRGQAEWQPPREDINSPDLYIPLMALVTYILIASLLSALDSHFHPDHLAKFATRAIAVVLVDFAFVKTGCYFLGVQGQGQVVDLIAYGGYKFVGVLLPLTASFLNWGRTFYLIVFLYAFLANAFFMLRSLRSVVLPDALNSPTTSGTVSPAQRSRRITFLFLEALAQCLYMGILVRIS